MRNALAQAPEELGENDGDIAVNLKTGEVTLCLSLPASSQTETLQKAIVMSRTAVHATGRSIASWRDSLASLLNDEKFTSNIETSNNFEELCAS